jgi:hypothetical protein
MQMQEENGTVQDDEGPAPAPQPEAPVKKPRKPRGPNKPKAKPADKPIDIPDDHPALAAEPDPAIDAVELARRIVEKADQETAPQNVQVRKPGTWGEIEEQILAARRAAKEQAEQQTRQVVPVRTPRQQEQFEAEVAAGQRNLARHQERERLRQQIPPDPNDPKPTPVFRPKDHVPDINSKDPGLASQDLK